MAAEGAVELARQRLVDARATLTEVREIERRNRSLLIGEKPCRQEQQQAELTHGIKR